MSASSLLPAHDLRGANGALPLPSLAPAGAAAAAAICPRSHLLLAAPERSRQRVHARRAPCSSCPSSSSSSARSGVHLSLICGVPPATVAALRVRVLLMLLLGLVERHRVSSPSSPASSYRP